MDFLNNLFQQLQALNLINLLVALAILIVGWIVARVIAFGVKRLLQRTNIDDRIANAISEGEGQKYNVERWVSGGIFYLIMLFVLIAFFQRLNLESISGPLGDMGSKFLDAVPNLVGALLILVAAWVLATVAKIIVTRGLKLLRFDERLSDQVEGDPEKAEVSESLGNGIFWLVFLLFLPPLLNALGMQGLVQPVQGVVDQLLGAIPNLFLAAIILVIGWFIARIVRQIISNLLAATNVDRFGNQVGIGTAEGSQPLSKLVGSIVYILILIPVVIQALTTLQIEALSAPAINMLNTVMNAIPAFFGALIVLGVAYFAGKLVSTLVSSLLTGVGFDTLPEKLGLRVQRAEGQRTMSEIAGLLVLVAVMFFAAIEAAKLLGLGTLSVMIANFTSFAGQVLLALVIFGIGLYLANLTRSVILSASGASAAFSANIARFAILVFVAALALQQLGIANQIVNLAFGILFGAIGVAAALAFGLGSREIAGKQVEDWLDRMKK